MGKKLEPHAALLRGVNVGGKNKLPMKHLVALFEAAGATDVRTYIQSGNVVFCAPSPRAVAEKVRAQIDKELGLRVPLIVRSARELRGVHAGSPFDDVEHVHVVFLADKPTAARVAALDPKRSPPDSFVVKGSDVYLHCPHGIGGTKLTNAYFDSKLATVSTARNWRTLEKLVEMTSATCAAGAT